MWSRSGVAATALKFLYEVRSRSKTHVPLHLPDRRPLLDHFVPNCVYYKINFCKIVPQAVNMKLFQLASVLLISTSTVVSAWQCLSDANAAKIVNDSVALLLHATPEQTDYARAAEYESLSPNIQQYGDSINALRGDPVSTHQSSAL